MKILFSFLLIVSGNLMAQNNVALFSFWKPKPGDEKNFENGYKQHLKWHKDNADKWNWCGWYFAFGSRDDQFLDATFNHSWGDFDKSVKPAEDGADNSIHTYPFADYQMGYRMINLPDLSISDSNSLKSKLLRLVTITVTNIDSGKAVLEKLKAIYKAKGMKTFMAFKMVDGGNLNQFIILIGLSGTEEFSKVENLQEELTSIEALLKIKTITMLTSETLVFRADMSLIH